MTTIVIDSDLLVAVVALVFVALTGAVWFGIYAAEQGDKHWSGGILAVVTVMGMVAAAVSVIGIIIALGSAVSLS